MSLTRSHFALTVALTAATAGGVGYAMHRSAAERLEAIDARCELG